MCRIEKNKARCGACGDVVMSLHRHDFKSCRCQRLAVDGGQSYLRRVFDGPYEELSTYTPCDDPACRDKDAELEASHEVPC